MCAELPGELGLVGAAADRDDLEAHLSSVLHAEMAEPSDAKYGDEVSPLRRRVPQRAERRQARAEQRRRVNGPKRVRQNPQLPARKPTPTR
jgi:hypothetical protein